MNEDGIIGQTGELLALTYCKNNPVNMSDKGGFRPLYTVGEETDDMRAASLASMLPRVKILPKVSVKSSILKKGRKIANNAVVNSGKAGISYTGEVAFWISKPRHIQINRQMKRLGHSFVLPAFKFAKYVKRGVSIFGIVDPVVTLYDDYKKGNYKDLVIDGVVIGLSLVTGVVFGPVGTAISSVLLGVVGDSIKEFF